MVEKDVNNDVEHNDRLYEEGLRCDKQLTDGNERGEVVEVDTVRKMVRYGETTGNCTAHRLGMRRMPPIIDKV